MQPPISLPTLLDVQTLFTAISPSYDKVNHWLSLGQDIRWRKQAVHLLPWPPQTPLRVLDLCAGTLDFGLAVTQRYPQARVHSVDFSLAMLQHGRKKIPPAGTDRYPLYCADALHLPFQNEQFDLVICAYGMRNIPDKIKVLNEVYRILKPNGYLGILEFFKPTNYFSKIFYKTYGQMVLPRVGGWLSKQKSAYVYLQRSIQDTYNLKQYFKLIEVSNFKILKKHEFMFGISSFILGKKPNPPCPPLAKGGEGGL